MKLQTSVKSRNFLLFSLYIAAFFPTIFQNFLWSDDYSAINSPASVGEHAIKDGRPVYGFLVHQLFEAAGIIDDVRLIRLLTLLGVFSLALWITNNVFDHKESKFHLAIFLGFCSFSWANVIFWAIAFIYPWAALASCEGIRLLNQPRSITRFTGGILVGLAFLSYPPACFFPIALTYIKGVVKKLSYKKVLQESLGHFTQLVAIGAIAIIFARAVIGFFLAESLNHRVQVVSYKDLLPKAAFFMTRMLTQSFRPFSIGTVNDWQIALEFIFAIMLITLIFILHFKSIRKSLQYLFLLFVVQSLVLSPFLIVAQNQIELRYFIVSNWLVVIVFMITLQTLVGSPIKNRRPQSMFVHLQLPKMLLWIQPIIGLLVCWVFFFSIVSPILTNTRDFIESEIVKCSNQELKKPFIFDRESDWPGRSYIGMMSQSTDLASSWVPLPALKWVIRESRSIGSNPEYVERNNLMQNACVIDLQKFKPRIGS